MHALKKERRLPMNPHFHGVQTFVAYATKVRRAWFKGSRREVSLGGILSQQERDQGRGRTTRQPTAFASLFNWRARLSPPYDLQNVISNASLPEHFQSSHV
jgi:hypothetical protein